MSDRAPQAERSTRTFRRLNAERHELITQQIAGTISVEGLRRLGDLNEYVDHHVDMKYERPGAVLEELELRLKQLKARGGHR